MNETTILQAPGSTRMIVLAPMEDRFARMRLTNGYTGETLCETFVLKRDVPAMIAELERDEYKIISTISINNFKDDANEEKEQSTDAGQGPQASEKRG